MSWSLVTTASSWLWSPFRLRSMRPPRPPSGSAFRQINKATRNRLRQQLIDEETREPVNKTVSESDAQSNCGIDVVALKIAVSQSAIHFREHQPGVEIPLRGKLPIDNAGDRVKRTGALRVLAAGTGQRPRGGGAVVRILSVMVIGGDYVQLVGNGVSHPGPHDLEDLVAETVAAEGRIGDVRVVEHDAALAQKIATDIGKTGLPIARGHVRNSFVARVKLEPLT